MKIILFVASFMMTLVINDHTGSWKYSVDTPDGSYTGLIVLESADGVYTGEMRSDEGIIMKLKDLEVEGNDISFNITVQGYQVDFDGTFKGDTLESSASVEGMEFPVLAKKVEE